jgi:hypothetical protein
VVSSVDRAVNVVMGLQGVQLSLAALSDIGVKRISVGSALSRAALGAFLRAAREMREHGTFDFANDAVSYQEISAMFKEWQALHPKFGDRNGLPTGRVPSGLYPMDMAFTASKSRRTIATIQYFIVH